MTASPGGRPRAAQPTRALWPLALFLLAFAGLGAAPAHAQAAFTQQPSAVVAGQAIAPTVAIASNGQFPAADSVTLSLTNANGATLSGANGTSDGSGNYTFPTLTVSKAGTYALVSTFSDSVQGFAGPTSSAFTVTLALAISFTQQPTNTVSGQPIDGAATPPGVLVHVASLGSNQAAAGQTVTIARAFGNGTLSGTTTGTTDTNGNVTFAGLSIDLVGTDALTASVTDGGGNPVTVQSNSFQITPGAPATLTFISQPRNAPLGLALNTGTSSPGVMVQAQDAAGNLIPGQAITVMLSSADTGTLSGTTTQTADGSGVSTFRDLKVSQIGNGYSLVATAGAASMTSATFNVVADPAPVVTSTADDGGFGTLRSVLGFVPAGGTVTFDPAVFSSNSTQTITLLGGEIDVTQAVTLTGPANYVIVSGNNQFRVFGITGGPVSFANLIARNGRPSGGEGAPFFSSGGGLAISGAAVTLTNCQVNNDQSFGGDGGGVYNGGALTLTGCQVTSNFANNDGGGVYNDGGVLTLAGSTRIQGNSANNDGGGVFNGGGGVLTATGNTSVQNNFANNDGGGVYNAGTFTATNSGFFSGFFGNRANNAGGGVYNSGTLLVTNNGGFSGFFSNSASGGGGVYNAGGLVTLSGITLTNDNANDGGGVYNAGGTLTMTACSVTNNSANDGGGVYDAGGTATLTSCTLTQNSSGNGNGGGGFGFGPGKIRFGGGSGSGGALFNVNGKVTLTDDILYGDTDGGGRGSVSEIAGPVTATLCDIQGNPGTPAAPDANGNFSADPQFTGGNFFGPAIQPSNTSPVLGRGTTNAPNFRNTDLTGQPFFNPPALGAVEGLQDTHILWTNPDGRTIFWDVSRQGAFFIAGNYDPFQDAQGHGQFTARALSTGPDGLSHVLWNTADGRVCLSSVTTAGVRTDAFYGPFSDDGTANTIWQAIAVSTDGNNVTHLLWDNPNGRTILWDVQSNGAFTVRGNYAPFSDDGTAATTWTAFALASGPDGLSHILWHNADRHTLLWNLDGADDQPVASPPSGNTSTANTYGVFEDDGTASTIWSAQSVSVGQDNVPHLLWANPNGRTILWNVNPADGSFNVSANYGGFSSDGTGANARQAVSLATGSDSLSHVLFVSADHTSLLWNLDSNLDQPNGSGSPATPSTNPNNTSVFAGYGPFSDDGSGNTLWQAIAVSAAQGVGGD